MNDGGPAFPTEQHTDFDVTCDHCKRVVRFHGRKSPGMSLRDYFAAAALNGLLSANAKFPDNHAPDEHCFAGVSYRMADAMVRAREEKP